MAVEAAAIAARLLEAEQARCPIPPLSKQYPDLTPAAAYEIQVALIERKRAQGARVVGRKIGLTSVAMQRLLGVDQPDYGHLLDTMAVRDGGSVEAAQLIQPKAEPEIAFLMGRDLRGPGVTAEQVLAATAGVAPAIEIIDSRIERWQITLCDTIADNASSARFVVGERPVPVEGCDLRLVGMVLEKNGEVVSTGAGAAVLGHPLNAVVWLVNTLAAFGAGVRAGDVVLPGALTAAVDVAAGDVVAATFDRLGSVSVRFV